MSQSSFSNLHPSTSWVSAGGSDAVPLGMRDSAQELSSSTSSNSYRQTDTDISKPQNSLDVLMKLDNEELPVHQDFINNPDPEISKFVIDIFTDEHELSPGWEDNKIVTTREDQQVSIAVVNSLYAFQLSKLTALIVKNQAKLKTETDSDIQMELLQEQVNLQQIKIQIANKLERIILRLLRNPAGS